MRGLASRRYLMCLQSQLPSNWKGFLEVIFWNLNGCFEIQENSSNDSERDWENVKARNLYALENVMVCEGRGNKIQ